MIRPVVFTSERRNVYLYSPFRNQITLLHPLVRYMYNVDQEEGEKLSSLAEETRKKGFFTLEGFGDFTVEEFLHHHKKYLFLKGKGFFRPRKRINLEGRLSPADIKENITGIKQLIFEVTEDCNLQCTYCTYSKFYVNKPRASREPDFPEIKKTILYFLSRRKPGLTTPLIISFYGGEPLKNMKLIRQVVTFCDTIPEDQCRFRFSMTSNGLLLKKEIEYLAAHDFDVSISLDGDSEANTYRRLKNNQPSYPIVVGNLEYVRENYPAFYEKNITFMSVLHNRNNFGTLEKFFREKYGKSTLMSDISTVGINEPYREEFYSTFIENKKDDRNEREPMESLMLKHPRVKDVADVVEKYSGVVFKNHYQMLNRGKDNSLKKKYIPTATCTPFSMRAFVTTEGKMLPCEHIGREFELGAVSPGRISINRTRISELFNNYFQKARTFCEKCYLANNCKECMFNTGIETEKPSCEYFMSRQRFSEYLSRHFSIIENDYPFYLKIANHAFRKEET